jgi:hypothetical protein
MVYCNVMSALLPQLPHVMRHRFPHLPPRKWYICIGILVKTLKAVKSESVRVEMPGASSSGGNPTLPQHGLIMVAPLPSF